MLAKLLPGLAAAALFCASGAGLLACLPRAIERGAAVRAGWAYLLGLSWIGLAAWSASFVAGIGLTRSTFATLALAPPVGALATALVRRRGLRGGARVARAPRRTGVWAAAALAAAAGAASLALLAESTAEPVRDFDGRMTWGTLARYVRDAGSVLPEALTGGEHYVIHPRYPLLMPLAQVAASELAGEPLESYVVRPVYALIYPALLLALWPTLVRAGGRRAAALASALLFLAPVVLWNRDVGPRGTFSDLPLAALLGLALAALLHPAARREPWRGLVAGVALAAAAGAKNEGLLLAPAVLVAVALTRRWRERARALGFAAVLLALGAALVLSWRSQVPNRGDEKYFEEASTRSVLAGLKQRLPRIADGVTRVTFDPERWGATFWILPLVVIAGRRGLRPRAPRAALWCLAAQVAVAVSAYAVAPRIEVIGVTWDRFLVQGLAPIAVLTAATSRAALLGALRPSGARAPSAGQKTETAST